MNAIEFINVSKNLRYRLAKLIKLVNIQTSFAKNVIKEPWPDNFTSMDGHGDGNNFVRKGFLHNMMASFNAFAHKAVFFKGAYKLFSGDSGKAGHQTVTSIDSRMGLRYSLKACLMPTALMYPVTASLRFAIASSGSSPCDIMSNSGQYTVYPPFDGSGINSAEICNRCIALPPTKSISQHGGAVKPQEVTEQCPKGSVNHKNRNFGSRRRRLPIGYTKNAPITLVAKNVYMVILA